jgi:hypothetical protein
MSDKSALSPEQELFTAILLQAITDLSDRDNLVRGEARSFFFGGGNWRDSREHICGHLGVDPEVLQQQLRRAGKVDPPPVAHRGFNPFSVDDVRRLIPNRAFRVKDLAWPESVSLSVQSSRIQSLVKDGTLEALGSDYYGLKHLKLPRRPSLTERLLALLDDEPQTGEQIAAKLTPRPTRASLDSTFSYLCQRGLVQRVAPGTFRLVRERQSAA